MLKTYFIILVSIFITSCASKKKEQQIDDSTNNKVTIAYKATADLGEGAIWNHETKELYWIDIEGKALHVNRRNLHHKYKYRKNHIIC